MSANAVKHKVSGVLPKVRPVLKNPTTKQLDLIEKIKQPLPKGIKGQGYAKGIKHPIGSHRDPPKPKFIDVDKFINSTMAVSKKNLQNNTVNNEPRQLSDQQTIKLEKSSLRRQFFIQSVKNYEDRLLKLEKLNKQREKLINLERKKELIELNKSKLSDLTIPTINDWINKPIMKQRSQEETEILNLKRKYNRDFTKFKNNEQNLIKLINLFHVADEFIVTEKQLIEKLDKLLPTENIDITKNNNASILNGINSSSTTHTNKNISNYNRVSLNNSSVTQTNKNASIENGLLEDIFGTVLGKPGLPMVKDFLNRKGNDQTAQMEDQFNQIEKTNTIQRETNRDMEKVN